MAFEIPIRAKCFAHQLNHSRGDICEDTLSESHSVRSVDSMRDWYRERFTDKNDGRTAEPEIKIYFEPTVGKHGTYYFLIIPGKVTGIEDRF